MNRNAVREAFEKRMTEAGVATHLMHTRMVPSRVEADVIVGNQKLTFSCMSGLPNCEVERKLAEFENEVINHLGQRHLEDAIAEKA